MNAAFFHRRDAGQKLAQRLSDYANWSDAIVLGLPRGGVPVAYEIANHLNLPLDVCLVRKLGLPNNPETAMGAIVEDALIHDDSGNIIIIDRNTVEHNNVKPEVVEAIVAKEKAELKWREARYRHDRPMLAVANRSIIVVDDGMATGLTMQAAVKVLSNHSPTKIIVATPVASAQAISKVENMVDDLVCLLVPPSLNAVGLWYQDFSQISDREVCSLLSRQACKHSTESYSGSC